MWILVTVLSVLAGQDLTSNKAIIPSFIKYHAFLTELLWGLKWQYIQKDKAHHKYGINSFYDWLLNTCFYYVPSLKASFKVHIDLKYRCFVKNFVINIFTPLIYTCTCMWCNSLSCKCPKKWLNIYQNKYHTLRLWIIYNN